MLEMSVHYVEEKRQRVVSLPAAIMLRDLFTRFSGHRNYPQRPGTRPNTSTPSTTSRSRSTRPGIRSTSRRSPHQVAQNPSGKTKTCLLAVVLHSRDTKEVTVPEKGKK